MLSDAPFASPWSSEVLVFEDFKLPVIQDSDDDDLFHLYKSTYVSDTPSGLESVSGSSSLTTGSECSIDDLYVDGDEVGFEFDIDGDTSIKGLEANLDDLIDSSTVVSVDWCEDKVLSADTSPDTWSSTSVPEASHAFTCSTVPPPSKCHTFRAKNTHCKKWSHMTKVDRSRMIDELSMLISSELSLREQMDIIKIINPWATFSKQKKEFVIDLNVIDDAKLEKIQDIINFHGSHSSDFVNNSHCHSPNKKFSKKSKSQDRRPKIAKPRVQKEYRQKLKERRSGLFVKEERLAVSETIVEEEIDILG